MKRNVTILTAIALLYSGAAFAKLPPPSDDAKAKAAEAAAKAAQAGKVAAYQLCKSMNRTAAVYYADAKKANKDVKPPVATPECADPDASPAAAPAPAAPAAPAPAGKPAAKK
jgi:hypothetical protein